MLISVVVIGGGRRNISLAQKLFSLSGCVARILGCLFRFRLPIPHRRISTIELEQFFVRALLDYGALV